MASILLMQSITSCLALLKVHVGGYLSFAKQTFLTAAMSQLQSSAKNLQAMAVPDSKRRSANSALGQVLGVKVRWGNAGGGRGSSDRLPARQSASRAAGSHALRGGRGAVDETESLLVPSRRRNWNAEHHEIPSLGSGEASDAEVRLRPGRAHPWLSHRFIPACRASFPAAPPLRLAWPCKRRTFRLGGCPTDFLSAIALAAPVLAMRP